MKILVIDDHRLFLDGIAHVLQQINGESVEVVASTDSIAALSILEAATDFDLILADLNMPRMNGAEFLESLKSRQIDIPVVIVSAAEAADDVVQLLNLGAVGFIPKSFSSDEMLAALHQVLQGQIFVPQAIQQQVARLQQITSTDVPVLESGINRLGVTKRQRDVLKLVARGYSNKEIALAMHLSESTVKSHIYTLFKTLQADSRTDCVSRAYKVGLIKPPADEASD